MTDQFDRARELYRDGKLLLDATRSLAATNDLIRWAREDLEWDLLDLKRAVIEMNAFEIPSLITDVKAMFGVIYALIEQLDSNDFEGEEP